MKADIEKIKQIFGITGRSENIEEVEPAATEDSGYTSHTFTVTKADGKRIGTLTISDVGEDVKNTVKSFLDTLIKDEKAGDNDKLTITLTSDTEDIGNEVIFTGTADEFRE